MEGAEPEINKIQTFVFFDLETTGLAGMDTRILELSMIAVSREDLLCMKNTQRYNNVNRTSSDPPENLKKSPVPKLPRVLHKYTRLYYPRKIIRPELEEITGLSNELLHRLPGFSSSSASAINLFLDLPKPVTLVAHNGARYDFPLVKAELDNVLNDTCELKSFGELLCVDTLIALRDIDACMKEDLEGKEILEITSLAASFSFEDMSDEMDLEPECKRTRTEGIVEPSRRVSTPPSSGDEDHSKELVVSSTLPITPMKDQLNSIVVSTPKTPLKAKAPQKLPVTPETSNHNAKVNGTKNVRRSLTYGGKKRRWDGTQPYKQVNIYKRLFGDDYDAHRAEADCTALLEICGNYSERFVEWADVHSTKFASVKPMWGKRKSFTIK